MKTAIGFTVGVVAVAVFVAGPLSAQQPAEQAAAPAQAAAQDVGDLVKGEVKQAVAVLGEDGVQRVEILGGGYFYNPNHVIVTVNVPVELTLKREAGFVPHDFVIKAPEAGIDVSESMDTKPKVVKFTPTKAGIYPFYCSKKMIFMSSHRDKGMKGVLEVQ